MAFSTKNLLKRTGVISDYIIDLFNDEPNLEEDSLEITIDLKENSVLQISEISESSSCENTDSLEEIEDEIQLAA